MNTTLMKKLMAIGMSVCLMVTFMPILPGNNAFAASEADTIAYDADNDGDTDVTYFNVTSSAVVNNYLDNPKEYIKGLLSEKYIGGTGYEWGSTYTTWETISFYLSRYYGWLPTDHEDMTDSLKAVTRRATNKQGKHTGSQTNGSDTWYVTNTGLKNSESVSDAHEDMANKIFEEYQDAGGSDDKREDVVKNISSLKDNDTKQTTWYSLISANKTSGSNKKGHYKAYGVIFHDFKLNPILREDDSYYTVTTTNPSDENGTEYQAGTTKNETNQTVMMKQSWADTQSYSETSEISGSKSYGFGETLTVGAEKSFGGSFKMNMEVSVSASQNIEKGWKNGTGTEHTQSINNEVSVEVPPYTNVMLLQSKESVTQKYVYDCPVALTYSATIVEFYRNPNSNDEAPKSKILGSFLGNATADLNQRAFVERKLDDKQGIEWDVFFSENVIDHSHIQNAITQNAKRAPMSMAGGTYTVTYRTTTSQVRDVMPILPLDKIKVADQETEYTLDAGESLNLSNIDLQGYNSKNAAYYGFSKDYGQWQLLDIGGSVVTASDVAELVTDNVTGKTTLRGKDTGVVYAKYIIDESKYATANQPNTYTKNSELSETATIKFNIIGKAEPTSDPVPTSDPEPTPGPEVHKCNPQLVKGKSATCIAEGKKDYYKCECGKSYEDAAGTKVITDISKWSKISKKPHSYSSSYTVDKVATTTANGSKSKHCTVKGCAAKADVTTIYAASDVKLSYKSTTYSGKVKSPTVIVKDSKGNTISTSNYTVQKPSGRINAGTYTYTITFKGNYTGSETLKLTINKKSISSAALSYTKTTYSGSAKKPTVTVKNSSGTKLTKDTHYTVTYASGRTKVGRYKVTIKGKGNYTGTITKYFTIVPKAPSSASAKLYGYDDVKFSWSKVSNASGYDVYYKKSTANSYTHLTRTTGTSTKKANLTDGVKYYFKVVPYYKSGDTRYASTKYKTASIYTLKKISTPTVSKSGTKVKVKWKNISGETGYQISRSTKKTGTNIVSTYKTTSGTYKIVKATKGKTYYYKVRAYKTVDGKKVYGPWSSVKSYKRK